MAIADYDPLFQPIRGKILGTVMQTGRNAPVIKSIDNNHGQQLRALQNSKAQLQHAATLWRELAPADQIIWDAKRPDFPTVDRYGNPVLSSAYSLFLRAIAHLPNDRQVFLTSPGSPFSGPLPPDAQVNNVGGVITFTSMDAPVGQNFDVSVFCTRYNPVSKTFAKPSFRRVLRLDDYTGEQTIDITSFIEQEFGPLILESRIFWCVKTWKTGTPELVGETCGNLPTTPECPYTPGLYTKEQVDDLIFIQGYVPVATAAEFDSIRLGTPQTMGLGTCWEGTYTTGQTLKYVQVSAIDFTSFGTWTTRLSNFTGTFDGNELLMSLTQTDGLFTCSSSFTLRNIRIDTTSTAITGALFHTCTGTAATISNIRITGAFEQVNTLYLMGQSVSGATISNIRFNGSSLVTNGVSNNGNSMFGSATNCTISDMEFELGTTFSGMVYCTGFFRSVTSCTVTNCRNFSQLIAYTNNGQPTGNCLLTFFAGTIATSHVSFCGIDITHIPALTVNCFRGVFANTFTGTMHDCANESDIISAGTCRGLINWVQAGGLVYNCVNNGDLTSNALNYAGLFSTVSGTVHDCVQNGNVSGTRNGAGLINTIANGGVAYNMTMNGSFTATNDGSGAGNQNGAGLVNTVQAGGVFRNSTMNGNLSMFRQCAGLVRVNSGECYELELNGDITSDGNMACGVYSNDGVWRDIKIQSIAAVGFSSGAIVRNNLAAGTVLRCLSTVDITGTNARGVCFSNAGTVTEAYYDDDVTLALPGAAGTGYSTVDLQTPTTPTGIYTGWGVPPWDFGTTTEYPVLSTVP